MRTEAAVLFEVNHPLRLTPSTRAGTATGAAPGRDRLQRRLSQSTVGSPRQRGPDRFLPHTLGHEGSGTVLAIGPGVTKVWPGDRVVLTWIKGDGAEVPSATYGSDAGTVNSGGNQYVSASCRCQREPRGAAATRHAAARGGPARFRPCRQERAWC